MDKPKKHHRKSVLSQNSLHILVWLFFSLHLLFDIMSVVVKSITITLYGSSLRDFKLDGHFQFVVPWIIAASYKSRSYMFLRYFKIHRAGFWFFLVPAY